MRASVSRKLASALYRRAGDVLSRPSQAHIDALAAAKVRDDVAAAEVDGVYEKEGIAGVRVLYELHNLTRGTPQYRNAFGARCVHYLRNNPRASGPELLVAAVDKIHREQGLRAVRRAYRKYIKVPDNTGPAFGARCRELLGIEKGWD